MNNNNYLTRWLPVALLTFTLGFVGAVEARELKVGVAAEPTSLDPHYHNLTPNNQISASIFEALARHDASFNLQPLLAKSWRLLDETTWQFELRKGVSFHDGSAFDAYDVVFSVCRIPEVKDSPGAFTSFTKSIVEMQVKDPYTLTIRTEKPFPLLAKELASVSIISSGGQQPAFDKNGCREPAGGWPVTDDFNAARGRYAVGTGPYRLEQFARGDKIELVRFTDYWGKSRPWEQITIKKYPAGTPLVIGLLKGEVDLIENPPVENFGRIMREGLYNVYSTVTSRVIYIMFNHTSEGAPPTVKGTGGKNPFLNSKVRKAVSLAINRNAIADRIMNNFAVPANQFLYPTMFGTDKSAQNLRYDPKMAKQLMEEAGYPNGFDVTFYATNDRYTNDEKIARSIAAMLTRIGIRAKLETMSKSVFFKRRNKGEYAIWMAGWGAASGEMSNPLRALVATRITEKGYGIVNRGGYSNVAIDGLLDQALETVDDNKREQLLIQAQAEALRDSAVVPLHFETKSWAMRRDLLYQGRSDEFTIVSDIKRF